MASSRERRKIEPPAEEGAPAWMNTYGDMITLLFTFFVLLFSFSTVDAQKWRAVAASFAGTPSVSTQAVSSGFNTSFTVVEQRNAPAATQNNEGAAKTQFDELYEKIKKHIVDNKLENELYIEKTDEVILLRIKESALFDSGRADIKPESIALLKEVSEIFNQYPNYISMVRIEGHTDNVPIATAQFKDNWDLSTYRAVNVLRFFLAHTKIDSAKFSAVGYGEFHPVASNNTPEGKAKNRRVDFVVQGINAAGGK